MWFTAITVAVGALIGVALGGRPRHVPEHSFHLWPLLLGGLALQAIVEGGLHGATGVVVVIVSYLLLLSFAALNLRLTGMGVVMVGVVMNLVPIAVNGGMPVRASALVDAHLVSESDRAPFVRLRGERHLERGGDHLLFLADIIPIAAVRQVVSFGDLVLGVGTATLIAGLLRPPKKRQWRAEP